MYAEIPRASIRFRLVNVSVMLIAPWIRGGGYAVYPQPRVVLNRCARRPEDLRGTSSKPAKDFESPSVSVIPFLLPRCQTGIR